MQNTTYISHQDETKMKHALIRALATAFGPSASVDVDGDNNPTGVSFSVAGEAGADVNGEASFYVRLDARAKRVEVCGCWPKSKLSENRHNYGTTVTPRDLWNPQAVEPRISFSSEKSPEQMVRDIQRRFIPDYLRTLSRCVAIRNQRDAAAIAQKSLAQIVGTALGETCNNQTGTRFSLPSNLTDTSCYGSAEVHGETVTFEIRSLDKARALKLVDFLKTL